MPTEREHRPIGIFDSGVGGLTVLRALHELMPEEPLLYLGDTARVPYGTRSARTVQRYALQLTAVLVERGVKALVVACNTATAHALDEIERYCSPHGIPVLGVIEPGAQAALAASRTGRVGVICTEGTLRGGAYQKLLEGEVRALELRACPLFVALAEEGWTTGEVPYLIAQRYLEDLSGQIDSLLLGCTHYPLLRDVIQRCLPEVSIVDSGEATARAMQRILIESGLQAAPSGEKMHRKLDFMVTDHRERFIETGKSFLGWKPEPTELVDFPLAEGR